MNAYNLILFAAGLALVVGQKGKVCYHPKEFADRCDDLYLEMVALDSDALMHRDATSCYIYRPVTAPNFYAGWLAANFDCQQPTSQLGPGELIGGHDPTKMKEIFTGLGITIGYYVYTAAYQPDGGNPAIEPDGGWFWYDGEGPKKQRKVNVTEAFGDWEYWGLMGPDPDDFSEWNGAAAHFSVTPPHSYWQEMGLLLDVHGTAWQPYVCEYFKCLENEFRDRQPRPNPFVPNGNGAENAKPLSAVRGQAPSP